MINTDFSPWPSFTEDEIEAVKRVLLSNKVNYWTGTECRKFETEFATFTNTKYAIALANGTVALDVALKSLGIANGDEVIITSRTFMASVSSIVNAGAVPVFADVNLNTQNVDADTINECISKKTTAIICVHLAGWPCDMDAIMDIAQRYNLHVIEDCAQAHGAKYKGRSVGSIGHVGAWSFCQDKIMTTGGEGGMVTTNDRKLWSKMWSYKDHGKSWEAVYERDHPAGFRWLHDTFGTNWRMTEMQAAIGRIQLSQMSNWNSLRRKNAESIWKAASQTSNLRTPEYRCKGCSKRCDSLTGCVNAAYKCYVFVKGDEALRDQYIYELNNNGVPCFSGSCSEVYLEKAFDGTGWRPEKPLPNAHELGKTSLAFLCHPTLTQREINLTCQVIKNVCSG